MDHAKTTSPCFASKTKNMDAFMWLPIAISDMIAHGHEDVRFAHFSLDLYPNDSNHKVGSVTKPLCDLEKPPTSSSEVLFENSGRTLLFDVVLKEKEVCVKSLSISLPLISWKRLPPTLYVYLENCWKDNNSK
jgi:hypothetical protein